MICTRRPLRSRLSGYRGSLSRIIINCSFFFQKYVEDICGEGCLRGGSGGGGGGEDSSYDSDCEADGPRHQDVSRTTSDTLAAEYVDYVQSSPLAPMVAATTADASPGYTAR